MKLEAPLNLRNAATIAGTLVEKLITPGQLLQVMVWPVLRFMTDRDLTAIYEYLRAIPHAEPGTACAGPGQ